MYDEQLKNQYELLINVGLKESDFTDLDFEWFKKDLANLDNPLQQMNRMIWFARLLAHEGKSPLLDPKAHPTLNAISKIADGDFQTKASKVLFNLFNNDSGNTKTNWLATSMLLNEKAQNNQQIFYLFAYQAGLSDDMIKNLSDKLAGRNYKDNQLMGMITEMMQLLTSEPSINVEQCSRIIKLVLLDPVENKNELRKIITACKELLLFERGASLKDIHNYAQLNEAHVKACQDVFGVKAENVSLLDKFSSERYPNALFTYAANLNKLSDTEKKYALDSLSQFVNSHLEGTFPESRYDFSTNPHLKKVFVGKEKLLEKWKQPFVTNCVASTANTENDVLSSLKSSMVEALKNAHLGDQQEDLYPVLMAVVNGKKSVENARIELNQLIANRLPSTSIEKSLTIQNFCLQYLSPSADRNKMINCLKNLQKQIPNSSQLNEDIKDTLRILSSPPVKSRNWNSVDTSDSWIDFLMLGTEVSNSCQHIDGSVQLNKCLLAYILDGKNKAFYIHDDQGKIAARCILRILWDNAKRAPVLFMERVYTATPDKALNESLLNACKEFASELQLPLLTSRNTHPDGKSYGNKIQSFGGPAPFEYVDALNDVKSDGEFTIQNSVVLS